jgi:hypothetical protein
MLVTGLSSEREFECRGEGGDVVGDLRESDVQSVIPKIGKMVIIVRGVHRGEKGVLI